MPDPGAAAPRSYVVAGAGVIGVCLAARLARAGAEVTLLEQDQPGRGATRSSFAWLNSNDKAPRAYHDLNHAGSGPGNGWPEPGRRRMVPAAGNLEWAASAAGRATWPRGYARATGGSPARLSARPRPRSWSRPCGSSPPPDVASRSPAKRYLLTEAMVTDLLDRATGHGARCWPPGPPGHRLRRGRAPGRKGARLGACGPPPGR